MVELSKNKEYNRLLEFMDIFCDRNETRLGYSIETTFGKSFSFNEGVTMIKLLSQGSVFESGFVEDIFDFSIAINNIEKDKVSDLITTIIFEDLIKYTQEQCESRTKEYVLEWREQNLGEANRKITSLYGKSYCICTKKFCRKRLFVFLRNLIQRYYYTIIQGLGITKIFK